MMKRSIVYSCLTVLNLFLVTTVFAQQGLIGDKDYRIEKFKKDIIQYSVNGGNLGIKSASKNKGIEPKIDARKCLEVYSDTTNTKLLVIKFGIAGDHTPRFWGILSNKEKYFFYDPDDTGESDLLMFKKKYDRITVATILFYCYQYPPEDMLFVPKASAMYTQNLAVIKDALHHNEGLNIAKVDSAKSFLESITSVKPGLNDGNSGRHRLTQEDYTRWLNWFKENYSKLYWDKNEQKVKIR